MISGLIRKAWQSEKFCQSCGALAREAGACRSLDGFPNPAPLLTASAGQDEWVQFFRNLVRQACPPTSTTEGSRPSWLVIPERRWQGGLQSPGLLLRAYNEAVPFQGREAELLDLRRWCEEDRAFTLRCYTGAGGMGKTRMGLELCRRMTRAGWLCGFLRPEFLPELRPGSPLLYQGKSPVLLLVDYAEHQRDAVMEILRWAARSDVGKIRALLLARSAGEWWQLVGDESSGLLGGNPTPLEPLAMSEADRQAEFTRAVGAFARVLGRPAPKIRRVNLKANYFNRILWIHMAALLALEGKQRTGEYAILDEVLRRERRFWRNLGETSGVPPSLLRLVGRAVCVFTSNDGARHVGEAVKILRRVPGLRDQPEAALESVANLLHECFPGERWIEPLQPDRLGDRLVEVETDRHPELFDNYLPA